MLSKTSDQTKNHPSWLFLNGCHLAPFWCQTQRQQSDYHHSRPLTHTKHQEVERQGMSPGSMQSGGWENKCLGTVSACLGLGEEGDWWLCVTLRIRVKWIVLNRGQNKKRWESRPFKGFENKCIKYAGSKWHFLVLLIHVSFINERCT